MLTYTTKTKLDDGRVVFGAVITPKRSPHAAKDPCSILFAD